MTYPLRMMHPINGWHHAYNAMEEARLRATGWVDDFAPPQEKPPIAVAIVSSGTPDGGASTTVAPPCIGNDPLCPCQDGDLCHYKDGADGTKALPIKPQVPAPKRGRGRPRKAK
jgi:hypothetical protein